MPRQFLLLAAGLVLLSGCASTIGRANLAADGDSPDGDRSAYGLFLAGEAALNDGQPKGAALYFKQAQEEGGDPELIGERAFTAALLSGDVTAAAALAPNGEDTKQGAQRLGRLVVAVEDMATGKAVAAKEVLADDRVGFPHGSAAALLAPWAAAMAGDAEGSLIRPEMGEDRLVAYFGQLGQAFLFERAKRYDEAETDFKALTESGSAGEMVVLSYGAFLERRGRRDDAVALYATALAAEPANAALISANARAAAGKPPPPMPSLKQGAAQALLAPAATLLAAKQGQIGLAYLRLVLRLDPQHDEAWILIGDVMSEAGELDSAREAYLKVAPASGQYSAARAKLAWTYQSSGEGETALKMAREAAVNGDFEARLTFADLLRANDQYAESAEVLSGLIKEMPNPSWRLYYARGVSYERLGRWPEAQADLLVALKQQPNEPELLNYLGYSWIDRGERLPEAMAMVEKAVAANPKSGAMVDSLGWAYYRRGDFKSAVAKLEEAVELDAGDPEINNHLGDAYWRVGRRDEAVFQWRRVLTLEPDDKIKADAQAKLASGLGPDGPAVSPKLAGQ